MGIDCGEAAAGLVDGPAAGVGWADGKFVFLGWDTSGAHPRRPVGTSPPRRGELLVAKAGHRLTPLPLGREVAENPGEEPHFGPGWDTSSPHPRHRVGTSPHGRGVRQSHARPAGSAHGGFLSAQRGRSTRTALELGSFSLDPARKSIDVDNLAAMDAAGDRPEIVVGLDLEGDGRTGHVDHPGMTRVTLNPSGDGAGARPRSMVPTLRSLSSRHPTMASRAAISRVPDRGGGVASTSRHAAVCKTDSIVKGRPRPACSRPPCRFEGERVVNPRISRRTGGRRPTSLRHT